MKSELLSAVEVKEEPKFPRLYTSNTKNSIGLIVFMHSAEQGTVLVQGNSPYAVGHYSELWQMRTFKPLDVSVTIKFN